LLARKSSILTKKRKKMRKLLYYSTPALYHSLDNLQKLFPAGGRQIKLMREPYRLVTKYGQRTFAVLFGPVLVSLCMVSAPAVNAQSFTVMHSFGGPPVDGGTPFSGLVMDASGNLVGAASRGGAGYGIIFRLTVAGNETLLHNFILSDGSGPIGSPVLDPQGNIYGITGAGGTYNSGTVFKLDPNGNITILYSTPEASHAGLIRDSAGNLYGTTYVGGSFGLGNVFKLGPDASGNPTVLTTLHSFGSTPTDATLPAGRLLLDSAGNLWGTTESGGVSGHGTIFKIDAAGNYSVVHSFSDTPDGAIPEGGLIVDAAGNFYGTTFHGGASDSGTVFRMTAAGALTVLHNFSGTGGVEPQGDLVRDSAGNIYGATALGGTANQGTVWKLDTSSVLTVLHSFAGPPDGTQPVGQMLQDASGNLYGTTVLGGTSSMGTVFKVGPAPATSNFSNFTARVVVTRLVALTAIAGQFSCGANFDPSSQAVTLAVAGANNFIWTFQPGAFKAGLLGIYSASATSGSNSVGMTILPTKSGTCAYTASITGFVPGTNSVSVSLTSGLQSGLATVNPSVL
jgi:uncharacterized repeat protein (TIGR03803 family)